MENAIAVAEPHRVEELVEIRLRVQCARRTRQLRGGRGGGTAGRRAPSAIDRVLIAVHGQLHEVLDNQGIADNSHAHAILEAHSRYCVHLYPTLMSGGDSCSPFLARPSKYFFRSCVFFCYFVAYHVTVSCTHTAIFNPSQQPERVKAKCSAKRGIDKARFIKQYPKI